MNKTARTVAFVFVLFALSIRFAAAASAATPDPFLSSLANLFSAPAALLTTWSAQINAPRGPILGASQPAVQATASAASINPPWQPSQPAPAQKPAPTPAPKAPQNYVTQGALNARLGALEKAILSELQTLATALTSIAAQNRNGNASAPSTFQQQLDALQREISLTNNIGNLSNVTITSPTFSGVTTSNVPEGSNLYYTDARVTSFLLGATATTTFGAGISASYLNLAGTTATSTAASTRTVIVEATADTSIDSSTASSTAATEASSTAQ